MHCRENSAAIIALRTTKLITMLALERSRRRRRRSTGKNSAALEGFMAEQRMVFLSYLLKTEIVLYMCSRVEVHVALRKT